MQQQLPCHAHEATEAVRYGAQMTQAASSTCSFIIIEFSLLTVVLPLSCLEVFAIRSLSFLLMHGQTLISTHIHV